MIALLVDIGNSRIKWRIARVESGALAPDWLSAEGVLGVDADHRIGEAFGKDAGIPVAVVWCSSVARSAVEIAVRSASLAIWPGATWRSARPLPQQCGVVNGYRDPGRLGTDRWLAMIGAHVRFPDRSLLVCGFGTATTIDLLSATEGGVVFVGGLILPGFDAMRRVLAASTARLPIVDGRTVDFAVDTGDAMISGVTAAQVGAVERAWRHAKGRLANARVGCVLAGGAAALAAPFLTTLDEPPDVVHDLVLRGLAAVAADSLRRPSVT